jgi:predicted nucleic acid-binding protein
MDIVLVESSAWISFFRGDKAACRRIDPLLQAKVVRTTGPVFVELVSGARNKSIQTELKALLLSIPWLPPFEPVWERVAETRFLLARIGRSCSVIDILIAQAASDWGAKLLTRERDFERMAGVLPLDLEVF